jgi:hypothetical protein
VDYLSSVVELLNREGVTWFADDAPTPRDVKYAVLHLQAATEVLLKARLLSEHWSLVFKDPGQASERRFREGDFETCGTDETVRRLRNIAGVSVSEADQRALKALAKDRNALQHYGLSLSAPAVEARAGRVLDFLVRFLDEELWPGLAPGEEHEIGTDLDRVRQGVLGIDAFVLQRTKRVYGELTESGQANRAVHCPECYVAALVIEPGSNRCHFCGRTYPNASLLARGDPWQMEPDPMTCSECQEPTVRKGVSFLDDPTTLYLFCYSCAARKPCSTT